MQPQPLPVDEAGRLESLRNYELLDTLPEQDFDDLTLLAAQICDVPVSLISIVDEHRQWFKSRIGWSAPETPRDISFCGHAILHHDVFVVPDATRDPRFANNPLVVADPHVRFYAGAPLIAPDGHVLGALCILDHVPRDLSDTQLTALRALSRQVVAQIELRHQARTLQRDMAERKRAAEALREREEQLRLYALHSPVAIAMLDRDMKYLVASRRWTEDFRLGDQPLVGRSHYEIFPALPQRWIEVHQRTLEGAVEKCDEDPLPRPDGTLAWFRWETRPWRRADGTIGGIIIFSEDITARKRTEAALLATENRYRTLFDYAPDGILIADESFRFIDANPGICRMLGYSREELIALHVEDIVAPAERPGLDYVLPAMRSVADHHREWQLQRKDGSLLPADVIATAMPDGHFLGMIRDVSERNRAIEAQRSAEERMRFTLENAEVGLWDMDYTTGILKWSETLERQYGFAPGTFGGSFDAFIERVHPDDRDELLETIDRAVRSGADFSTNHRVVWPDGTVRWLNGAGRILHDPQGAPLRGVGISLDVTERHHLEVQYAQAQKMEAVGRLAGGVAHDFNNLLTGILGYCELLLDALNPQDPLRFDVEEIVKAGSTAAALTRQLLAFSRRQIVEPALLDLNRVVLDMRGMFGRLIGEDISIVLGLSSEPPHITADRGQIEQILLNLAVNARDAMPTGGTLRIQTMLVELDEHYAAAHINVTPGQYAALVVTDTGAGMTPDVQTHVFEPFFTTKEVGKGTGLGLATVHAIVSRSGGSIGVYSEIGKGTTFKIYLPLARGAAPLVDTDASGERPLAGHTVLVVEDADSVRQLTRRLLEREGYSVRIAATAEHALRIVEEDGPIDVLLTDVVMPGTSGPELAARVLELRPGIKVIYMSGYTEETIVQHGIRKSGIGFLHKPFTARLLSQRIQEALGR